MDSAILMDFVFDDDEMLELQAIRAGVVTLSTETNPRPKKVASLILHHSTTYAASNSSQIMSLHHGLGFARVTMTVLSSPQWDLM